jgi:sugar phosphate isomerase/epimerase
MAGTRTGGFPIGFRRGWSDWQKDLSAVVKWAKDSGFGALDVGGDGDKSGKAVVDAGLRIGSVDLLDWGGMISPDAGKRKATVEKNSEYVKKCAPLGPANYFAVMLPEKADLKRAENHKFMVDSFSALAPVMEANKAKLVVEGWPGPGALCCTPEGFRSFFRDVPSKAMGVNFDPSHLIRMGIDPMRFLAEFRDRVFHVHGKDTELFADALQEYGHELPPTFGPGHGFGSAVWRYTIPGHGQMPWIEAFKMLKDAGYKGCVSVELEDENFNGTEAGEKLGLTLGLKYLEGC